MNKKTPVSEISRLVAVFGYDEIFEAIKQARQEEDEVLTIVSNKGLHAPPEEHLHGEVFFATEGPLVFNNIQEVEEIMQQALISLKEKLLEKRWKKIYLIPFGHVVINMHIKLTVFRTLWMDTTDIFYFGNNRYAELSRDSRNSLV